MQRPVVLTFKRLGFKKKRHGLNPLLVIYMVPHGKMEAQFYHLGGLVGERPP